MTGTDWAYSTDGVTFHCLPTAGGAEITAKAAISTNYASATLSGLTAGTGYTLYATCTATNGTAVKSPESTFSTTKPSAKPALGLSWLEIPAAMTGSEMGGVTTSNLFTHTFYYGSESDSNRNYTVCYDKSKLTTYWVAYPLNSSHLGSTSRTDEWAYVSSSLLAYDYQPNIVDGSYNSSASGNGTNNYSRGHLLPSSSRTNGTAMNEQTFLSVNLVPQIQNSFNSGVWSNLESALQSQAASDDLYVVTGTALQKGSDEEIGTMAKTYDQSGKEVAVPRYFYKVVLKVNSASSPTTASAVGFWFTNEAHSGSYEAFAVSVDEIESKLGMDFFPNLPDTLESSAEANDSWSAFQSF